MREEKRHNRNWKEYSGRQHRDKGDQKRAMDKEEEGLYQDPCCS
jgi:hypothetical protein